jgi:hypothetical protein
MDEPLKQACATVERIMAGLRAERVLRFDLAYPPGHAERDARMPKDHPEAIEKAKKAN